MGDSILSSLEKIVICSLHQWFLVMDDSTLATLVWTCLLVSSHFGAKGRMSAVVANCQKVAATMQYPKCRHCRTSWVNEDRDVAAMIKIKVLHFCRHHRKSMHSNNATSRSSLTSGSAQP